VASSLDSGKRFDRDSGLVGSGLLGLVTGFLGLVLDFLGLVLGRFVLGRLVLVSLVLGSLVLLGWRGLLGRLVLGSLVLGADFVSANLDSVQALINCGGRHHVRACHGCSLLVNDCLGVMLLVLLGVLLGWLVSWLGMVLRGSRGLGSYKRSCNIRRGCCIASTEGKRSSVDLSDWPDKCQETDSCGQGRGVLRHD